MLTALIGEVTIILGIFGLGAYWAKKKTGSDISLIKAAYADVTGTLYKIKTYVLSPSNAGAEDESKIGMTSNKDREVSKKY